MSESIHDRLARVAGMGRGDPTWDLSENDCEAISFVLRSRNDLLRVAKRAKDLLQPELVKEPDRTIFWELVDAISKAEGIK